MPILLNKNESVVVLGEAMIELSGITENSASIGVAGDTFNTAVYLARQDVDVQYVTALGVDQFSDRIRRALTAEHIGTDWIRTIPERIPGLYAISVDDEGERSFDYWRRKSAARKLFEAEGIEEVLTSISSTGLLYISGITLSIMRDRIYELTALAERVRENGGHVVFDTNYRPKGWSSQEQAMSIISRFAPFVSIALPTLEDDCALFGLKDAVECAEKWQGFGASEVVVKAGGKGAYLPNEGWIVPPNVIKPLDTTGAGDSFNGGYLGARIKGAEPSDAALAAHKLAAKVLMTPGAILKKEV
jgi:2-dehydro-3-deoxygluconokinase